MQNESFPGSKKIPTHVKGFKDLSNGMMLLSIPFHEVKTDESKHAFTTFPPKCVVIVMDVETVGTNICYSLKGRSLYVFTKMSHLPFTEVRKYILVPGLPFRSCYEGRMKQITGPSQDARAS